MRFHQLPKKVQDYINEVIEKEVEKDVCYIYNEYSFIEELHDVDMDLENYYGSLYAIEIKGEYYLTLNCTSGMKYKSISKEFYEAVKKEFGVNKKEKNR